MKLVTYYTDAENRIAAMYEESKIIDLNEAYKAYLEYKGEYFPDEVADARVPSDSLAYYYGGDETHREAKKAYEFALNRPSEFYTLQADDVKIGPPVLNPNKVICVGHNYREHILEMGRDLPTHPVLFAKFNNAILGPEDNIPYYSNLTEKLDYEAEFTFVVGKQAKNVPKEEALEYVAGYTIVNDVTSRDMQKRTLQWLQGKSVDGSAPMGPWLVTSDELQDTTNLDVVLHVNGEERQRSNTKNLVFDVAKLVEFLSEIMTLEPGDVICTGTPGGVGVAMNPPQFLKGGDKVTISVDQVGTLENTVKEVHKEKVKEYANKINSLVDEFVETVRQADDGIIDVRPSEEEWSILEVVNHVNEANQYWLTELKRVTALPGTEWGRGLTDSERLRAVEEATMNNFEETLKSIQSFRANIRREIVALDDEHLDEESPHRNPKFGTKPVSFLLEHFMVEHIEKHIAQVKRNMEKLQK